MGLCSPPVKMVGKMVMASPQLQCVLSIAMFQYSISQLWLSGFGLNMGQHERPRESSNASFIIG